MCHKSPPNPRINHQIIPTELNLDKAEQYQYRIHRDCHGALCVVAFAALSDTITVTNTNDSGPGSLREALSIATDGVQLTSRSLDY
jgi:hypothetical protein